MQLAEVIGTVVATRKVAALHRTKFLVIQPITPEGAKAGSPLVAVDTVGAGYKELVFYVRGKEAGMAVSPEIPPVDASITGIIDSFRHCYTVAGNPETPEEARGAGHDPRTGGR
jgi:ethanolamine utilization protein EutN